MAFEEKVIEHLTKEIEVTGNSMAAFRTRVNFTLIIGPFLLSDMSCLSSRS
jgi:hypothetical protein